MLNNLKLNGSPVCGDATRRREAMALGTGVPVAPRLSGLVAPTSGTGLSGSALSSAVVLVSAKREGNERPILAPVAGAWAHAYAAAGGAEAQVDWAVDASFIAVNGSTTRTQQTMRAFRGLEPWRDPA